MRAPDPEELECNGEGESSIKRKSDPFLLCSDGFTGEDDTVQEGGLEELSEPTRERA